MSKIRYIRGSTKDQNLDRQFEKLKKGNLTTIIEDKLSGKNTKRPKFQKLLE